MSNLEIWHNPMHPIELRLQVAVAEIERLREQVVIKQTTIQNLNEQLAACQTRGGYADNGFSRDFPPAPYVCSKCMKMEVLK